MLCLYVDLLSNSTWFRMRTMEPCVLCYVTTACKSDVQENPGHPIDKPWKTHLFEYMSPVTFKALVSDVPRLCHCSSRHRSSFAHLPHTAISARVGCHLGALPKSRHPSPETAKASCLCSSPCKCVAMCCNRPKSSSLAVECRKSTGLRGERSKTAATANSSGAAKPTCCCCKARGCWGPKARACWCPKARRCWGAKTWSGWSAKTGVLWLPKP